MESAVLKYAQREAEILQLNKTNKEMQEQLTKLQGDYDALHIALRGHKNEKYAQERVVDEKVHEASWLSAHVTYNRHKKLNK